MNLLHPENDNPQIEAKLKRLLREAQMLHNTEIDLSLGRMTRFLNRLGDPHLKLAPVIHIAGTNGKGSTLALLRSILEASGKKVHVTTSPHLVHPTERIRLAGELISSQMLADTLQECLDVNGGDPITYFEIFMAVSFLAMSRVSADYCLVETGLGGRFDASNVIPKPLCTIITNISKDHSEFLGETLPEIAFEKAGIMKAGVPCIIGRLSEEAREVGVPDVFQDFSQGLSPEASLYREGSEWLCEAVQGEMQFTWQNSGYQESIRYPMPNLIGEHQVYNAGCALAACRIIDNHIQEAETLSTSLTAKEIVDGLKTAEWPGRLQNVTQGRLYNIIKLSQELWLDGGHNDSAGKVLAQQARQWKQEAPNKNLHLIVAMVDRKDPVAFLQPLVPYAETITLMEIANEPSSFKIADIEKRVEPLGFKKVYTAETIEHALQNDAYMPHDRILVTGSLYFLGRALSS